MVKRKLEAKVDDDCEEKVKRHRQTKWSQEETEWLCDLLLEHGSSGIMAKTTNSSTNEKKKKEWTTISMHFNANPSVCVCSVCSVCITFIFSLRFFFFLSIVFLFRCVVFEMCLHW